MAKSSKKAVGFVKPTLAEVEAFIDTRMKDWPTKFCHYYAEKFYYHYQSNGWKQSSGVAIKDWQAAFFSRWQSPSIPQDIKFLELCLKEPVHQLAIQSRMRATAGMFADQEIVGHKSPIQITLEYLEEIRRTFEDGKVTDIQLRAAFDWFEKNNLSRMPPAQVDHIKTLMAGDRDYGKLLAIKQIFRNIKASDMTVISFYHFKNRPRETTNIEGSGQGHQTR